MLPTVTRILALWADFSGVAPDVLENAARRGTAVHRVCGCLAQGLWFPEPQEDCAGYVESFLTWFPVVESVILSEGELVDKALGYRGHPDLICRIRGDKALALVDFKTPATKSPLWRAQLAAYKRLAEIGGYPVKRVGTLRLKKDGSRPIFDEYTDSATDLAGFVAALNAHRYFNTRQ
jgi:hypothetical protein